MSVIDDATAMEQRLLKLIRKTGERGSLMIEMLEGKFKRLEKERAATQKQIDALVDAVDGEYATDAQVQEYAGLLLRRKSLDEGMHDAREAAARLELIGSDDVVLNPDLEIGGEVVQVQ